MEGVGHAPESLEVNDLEYAGQLTEFFRQGFTKSLVDPSVTVTTKKMADTRFAVDVKVETTGTFLYPFKYALGQRIESSADSVAAWCRGLIQNRLS